MNVLITNDGAVRVITLNRPNFRNALNPELMSELSDALAEADTDERVRVVVIAGSSHTFCAGADLSFEPDPAPDSEGRGPVGLVYRSQEHLAEMILAVHECDKPIVAAVHGAAVGGGLALALACDLRVATTTARFGAAFITVGLSSCDVGVSYFLPRLIGPTRAAEMMLTGRHVSGAEADAFGLLNRLVDDEAALLPTALELATQVAATTEYGRWMTKRGMWLGIDAPSLRHAIELENRTQVLGTFTGNMTQAAVAFMDKRDPEWKPL